MDDSARPKLSSEACLRFDRHLQRYFLVAPESGVLLSGNAASIVRLCTGEHTVEQIVQRLCGGRDVSRRDDLARDVRALLDDLLERTLVRLES
ncbi:MAG TPA: PqqD family peptide modification chaperone [Polyangiales bacterium]|nr:PqqD family peptide modification chaperone [Polyangiales bacterium]